ncbi:MAG: EAL domain-containing protein [Pseudomonadales bacterium]|nr:EAL domain-containing protein [Pseudomonadales bacterium]
MIAMTTSALALTISGVFFSLYDYQHAQAKAEQEFKVIATILADRSTAALEFFDEELAKENLAALNARTAITLGCLYDSDDNLFASFDRETYQKYQCVDKLPHAAIYSDSQFMEVRQKVILDESVIGTLYLLADQGDLRETMFLHLITSIIIILITLFITFLLSIRLQAFVTKPIKKLQDTVIKIRQSDNYALRAEKTTEDELGDLVDAFNGMVAKIEHDNVALRDSEERFRTLTASSPVGVFQTDEEGQYTYVNARWREITNIYDIHLTQEAWIKTLHPEERYQVLTRWREALASGEEFRMEYRLLRDDGEDVNVICHSKPLLDADNNVTGFLGSVSDISELKSVQLQLEQLALYDPLTKLANRHLFRNRLEKAIKQCERDHTNLALLFLDIDHFKKINDTMGHDQGDELLKAIAHRLRFCTRPGDTVSRMGGDEFTILIPSIQHSHEADAIARKILDVLKVPIRLTGLEVIVTTSIGITIGLEDAEDANTLMKNADLAMYRAKAQGRDNYQFFSDEMNIELTRQLSLEGELRKALQQEEFELFYQPQVDLASNKLIGYEALLRWNHPEKGFISPTEFIPVAEDSGLILSIGEWVLRTACNHIKQFTERGLLPKEGHVAVNLSSRQFHDPNLITVINDLITNTGINSNQLEIEITESLLMENLDTNIHTLNHLKQLGIILAIDDFGTGYSSLNYLKRLPIHILKVDRSFVMDIPQDKDDMEITAAVIAMAHKLRLGVVAEGVEQEEQAEFLKENGCNSAQGFFYGKPMSVKDLYENIGNFEKWKLNY